MNALEIFDQSEHNKQQAKEGGNNVHQPHEHDLGRLVFHNHNQDKYDKLHPRQPDQQPLTKPLHIQLLQPPHIWF